MFSDNNRPWSPWHSAYCCLSLSFNIMCRCLITRLAAFHPAFGNPLLGRPAPGTHTEQQAGSVLPKREAQRRDYPRLIWAQGLGLAHLPGQEQAGGHFLGLGKIPSHTQTRSHNLLLCFALETCSVDHNHVPVSQQNLEYALHIYVTCRQCVACGD